jgi:hypothetical protein
MNLDRLRIKIERAKEQFSDLQSEISAFRNTCPYKVSTKRNPQTRQLIYYLSSVNPVPDRIAAMAGEIIQDLRSSLDHLAYALWIVGTGNPFGAPARHVQFPIYDSAERYIAGAAGQVQGLRESAIKAIDAVKPYKGGNDTPWVIHKLNNIDKHRFVILVGSAFRSVDLGAHAIASFRKAFPDFPVPDLHAFFKPADRLFPLKEGDELLIDAVDAEVNDKMHFQFEVAFGESGILEGESLIETLKSMADVVENLLTDFEPFLV